MHIHILNKLASVCVNVSSSSLTYSYIFIQSKFIGIISLQSFMRQTLLWCQRSHTGNYNKGSKQKITINGSYWQVGLLIRQMLCKFLNFPDKCEIVCIFQLRSRIRYRNVGECGCSLILGSMLFWQWAKGILRSCHIELRLEWSLPWWTCERDLAMLFDPQTTLKFYIDTSDESIEM